jgi:hypothetical protein
VLRDIDGEVGPATGILDSDPPAGRLLAALASMLHEATSRFEETSDRIAQLVVERETGAGPELIVALQDFDRLRQDFVSIGNVLARCAKVAHESPSNHQIFALRDVLADIPLVDFKRRLAQCLVWMSSPPTAPDGPSSVGEKIF